MAWELQQHMHHRVAPSVWHYAQRKTTVPNDWLAEIWADQRCTEDPDTHHELLCEATDLGDRLSFQDVAQQIATWAIENENSTTNGGHEVYLDGWTSVPWCSDEQVEDWYA
jgi:hypothetical protein